MEPMKEQIIIGLTVALGSSFVNFIATKVYNSATGFSKNFMWKNKYPKLKNIKFLNNFEELKKRTRILVIDDEDSFPVSLFKADGYSIDQWNSVKEYNKLVVGFYDIIILDIKGVARHISEDDGLGVLESIKKENPTQIIIAYSQYSYDLSKARFWELADEKIAKPSDYLKMKTIVDNLIYTQFKPQRYIDIMHSILRRNKIAEKNIRRLDIKLSKSIKDKTTPEWDNILCFIQDNPNLYVQIKTIASIILKFY